MDAIHAALDAQRYRDEATPPREIEGTEYHNTDWGNALRLIDRHGQNMKFCFDWGAWIIWSGRYWGKDRGDQVKRLTKETILSMYAEAAGLENTRARLTLVDHIRRSEGTRALMAMAVVAQSEPGIPVLPEQLDTDPWKLTVLNGTIDLKTATLLPHRREDLITKCCPVEYDPEARAPTFEKFMDRIFNRNENLISYVQRIVGYALTGDTREQVLFFLHGDGSNGKTTLVNIVAAMLAGHAKVTAPELLLASKRDAHPTALADLQGVRFSATVEVEEGKKLAEILVKQLTGGDRMKARLMHHDFFEFDSTAKIFLVANHKPTIRGTDLAIWRRIRLIPFDVTIPEEEQDKTLLDKLRGELPGILAWAVRGCLEWQMKGLGTPSEVTSATQQYRADMDVLGVFIEQCCVEKPEARAQATVLYKAYKTWCDDNGEESKTQKDFGVRLGKRGFDRFKDKGLSWWFGIGLLEAGRSGQSGP